MAILIKNATGTTRIELEFGLRSMKEKRAALETPGAQLYVILTHLYNVKLLVIITRTSLSENFQREFH